MEVTLCGIPKLLVDYETVAEMLRPVGTVSFVRFEPNIHTCGTFDATAVLCPPLQFAKYETKRKF